MKKIGLLSDTHSYLHPKVFEHFKDCDEIWHAGDIGNMEVLDQLAAFKPLRAVYGNIDGQDIRKACPKDQRFFCEEVGVWMTHIGGYPKRYKAEIRAELKKGPPQLFICGHSHILKVMYDEEFQMLHMNPGAAGKYGIHQLITLLRFQIDKDKISNLEVIELPKTSAVDQPTEPTSHLS
jgi:putative phosphoesterase